MMISCISFPLAPLQHSEEAVSMLLRRNWVIDLELQPNPAFSTPTFCVVLLVLLPSLKLDWSLAQFEPFSSSSTLKSI